MKKHSAQRARVPSLLVVAVTGLCFAVGGVITSSTASAAPANYYLDCAAGNDAAAGTSTSTPWKTLAKVNAKTFAAGDTLNLKAGTSCAGTLTPHGSGTAAAPIKITSYGSGAAPKIVAADARAAVYLHNVQGWEIRNLDITDTGAAGPPRIGIYVEAADFGTARHFVVENVVVHDINGCDCTGLGEISGGIVFRANGSTTATGFDDIKVMHNVVRHVDGIGISTSSLWAKRALYTDGPGTFVPMTHVVVCGNSLSDLGGDGIVVQNGSLALVQNNVVNGFGLRASAFHAGVWSWNSDGTVIQYNDISHGGGPFPAEAMDLDAANNGVVYQYNSSHDNNGGMILMCSDDIRPSKNSTVRFNSSSNDLDGASGVVIIACDGPQDNTVFASNSITTNAATVINVVSPISVAFTSNSITGRASGSSINDPYGVYQGNTFTNILNPPVQQ